MKNILISIKILVVFVLLASCSDSYLDVNEDPNNPVTVSPNLILPVALNYSSTLEEQDRGLNHLGNMFMANWSQSDGFSWYTDEFAYQVTPSFYDHLFDNTYGNALKQYHGLETLEGEENGNYKAIAKIMKSLHFQILVDVYGDIPYSEALLRGENPTPVYDDAQTVYESVMNDLSDAIELINTTSAISGAVIPGDDDGIFGGDMDMWKTFANTIKLRMLVRQSDMAGRGGYIQAEFDKIAAEGSGFMNDDVLINIGYNQTDNQQNPKWNGLGQDVSGSNRLTNDATCATPWVLNKLNTTNDGRLDFLFEEPATGHLGVDQGINDYDIPVVDQFIPDNVSNIGPGILKGPDQGAVIYTAAESYLNRAEAALKGYIASDAKTMYEAGVQASFDYLGAGDATTYLSQSFQNVGYDNSANKQEAIIVQKWIATMGINALQSWFDYSRTGFPSDVPLSLKASTADRPVRLFYPSSELTSNGGNLPSQPNAFTSKIFWAN